MKLAAVDKHILRSRSSRRTTREKIIQFPLVRLVIALLFIAPVIAVNNILGIAVLDGLPPSLSFLNAIEHLAVFGLLIIVYGYYTKWLEKRPAFEVSGRGAVAETGVGFAVGAAMVLVVVAVLAAGSFYSVAKVGPYSVLLTALTTFGIGAFFQELVFRVILFRTLETLWGSWVALFLVSILFVMAHGGNPNMTWEAGLLMIPIDLIFTAAFIFTRRIWLVWGLHWGWNYVQDGVLGLANSGVDQLESWLMPTLSGPTWLTGGAFGIEASYLAVALNLALGLWLMNKARHHQLLIKPGQWRTQGH